MILAPDDMANAKIGIVGTGSQVISRHAVRTQQGEVFDIRAFLHLVAVHRVRKADHPPSLTRYSKSQRKGLPCSRAPVALFSAHLPHVRIEQPSSLRS